MIVNIHQIIYILNKARRVIYSKYLNDLKDKAVARSTFFKYIPSGLKNVARKTDLCNICAQYTIRKKLFENKINTAIENKAEIEEIFNEEKSYRLHKFCVNTQKNIFNET
ncbi:hypothetical protein K502DRAFT_354081 [Neoconidiobolus thromboides FSU 785]|nr:hypothetical protein K502DRAFT_354081 [Neoconidiobolus thromboides FSU 785]